MNVAGLLNAIQAQIRYRWQVLKEMIGLLAFLWVPLLLSLIAASIALHITPKQADGLRYAGLALEILGVLAVALGLTRKARAFGRSSGWRWFCARVCALFGPMPPAPVQMFEVTADLELHLEWNSMTLMNADVDFEERLKVVEANIRALHSNQQRLIRDNKHDVEKLETADRDEAKKRRDDLRDVRRQLKDSAVGDLQLEAIGIGLVICGLMLATLPDELTTAFRWMGWLC